MAERELIAAELINHVVGPFQVVSSDLIDTTEPVVTVTTGSPSARVVDGECFFAHISATSRMRGGE